MAYPKKRKGWRIITVDGQRYRWRYSAADWQREKALGNDALLVVQGAESGGQQRVHRFTEWPHTVTPAFVAQEIRQWTIALSK